MESSRLNPVHTQSTVPEVSGVNKAYDGSV